MILVKKVGALYDRCSSIEINDFSRSVIRVNSLDSFTMSEASISSREELKLAVVSAVLKIYLKDEVVISDELVTQLSHIKNHQFLMYKSFAKAHK